MFWKITGAKVKKVYKFPNKMVNLNFLYNFVLFTIKNVRTLVGGSRQHPMIHFQQLREEVCYQHYLERPDLEMYNIHL